MNEHLNRLSDEYERRFANAKFRPEEEFKAEFFRKARQLPGQPESRVIKMYPWIGAVAAIVALCLGLFLYCHSTANSKTSLLAEARRLFEPDGLGVALINGELFTFDRCNKKKVESLFEIEVNTGGNGQPVKIQFAAANGDLIRIDSPRLKGEFWVYRIDKNLFALESNCKVKMPSGKDIQIAEMAPVGINGTSSEKINRLVITRKVMTL